MLTILHLHGKKQSQNVLESPGMFSGKPEEEKLFLASNSPRRKELMTLCGWEYDILTPQVDESPLSGEDGAGYVRRLAKAKVLAASKQVNINSVIVAADTTVINGYAEGNARIFGKPRHRAEAVEMLQQLRGHTHQVLTAISIFSTQDGAILSDLCTTDVPMRDYSDNEIEAYVASGDPMDKAGAYAIQHDGFHPVENLAGCFANVMGLPLCHLRRGLQKLGIKSKLDVPQACQAALRYNCPVYSQILGEKNRDYTWSS